MCNISRDTILRASRRASLSTVTPSRVSKDGFTVSVNYRGSVFTQFISAQTMRDNYGRALARL